MTTKFRVWDKVYHFWISSCVVSSDGTVYNALGGREVTDEVILLFFIGLLDKNGKEIYEGDIVLIGNIRCLIFYSEQEMSFLIKNIQTGSILREARFDGVSLYKTDFSQTEVIGNIYENPELLKGTE